MNTNKESNAAENSETQGLKAPVVINTGMEGQVFTVEQCTPTGHRLQLKVTVMQDHNLHWIVTLNGRTRYQLHSNDFVILFGAAVKAIVDGGSR